MTIFRVNTDRDEAQVVKRFKKHPELVKVTQQWNKVFAKFRGMMDKDGKRVVKLSRLVYRSAEKTLKDLESEGSASPSDLQAVKDLMKSSYALTVSLKKLGVK